MRFVPWPVDSTWRPRRSTVAGTDVDRVHGALVAALGDVRAEVTSLIGPSWRGAAATAFREGYDEWERGARQVLAALVATADGPGRHPPGLSGGRRPPPQTCSTASAPGWAARPDARLRRRPDPPRRHRHPARVAHPTVTDLLAESKLPDRGTAVAWTGAAADAQLAAHRRAGRRPGHARRRGRDARRGRNRAHETTPRPSPPTSPCGRDRCPRQHSTSTQAPAPRSAERGDGPAAGPAGEGHRARPGRKPCGRPRRRSRRGGSGPRGRDRPGGPLDAGAWSTQLPPRRRPAPRRRPVAAPPSGRPRPAGSTPLGCRPAGAHRGVAGTAARCR